MSITRSSKQIFKFCGENENAEAFSPKKTNLSKKHLFMVHFSNNLLCLEYVSRSFEEITYNILLKLEWSSFQKELDFIHTFSVLNNTFVLPVSFLEQHEVEISEENPLNVEFSFEPTTIRNEFCGLANLKATCYINSLMQTLRYMSGFQEKLFNSEKNTFKDAYYSTLLRRLFYNMSTDSSGYDYTYISHFIRNLSFVESIGEHQDVHEFSLRLFERLEKEDKALTAECIEGKNSEIFKFACGCKIDRTADFQDIPLQMLDSREAGKTSMHFSLDKMCESEEIEEYNCEKHGKTSGIKTVRIKKAPKYLFCLIKRFSFDWEMEEHIKDHSFYSYPNDLDISDYMAVHDSTDGGDDSNCDQNSNSTDSNSSDCSKYTLHSVIVHSGSTSKGHYYAYININGKFFKFNDTQVNEVIEEEVFRYNFGGTDEFTGSNRMFSAYCLVYKQEGGKNDIYNLERVPRILTDEISLKDVKILNNSVISGYTGPGPFNLTTWDYPKQVPFEQSIGEFDNVECRFRGYQVYQFNSLGDFVRLQDTPVLSDGPLFLYPGQNSGTFVFLKEFDLGREPCNLPGSLFLKQAIVLRNLDCLLENGRIYRELPIDIDQQKNLIDNNLVEEITDLKKDSVKDGDVLIVTNDTKASLSDYLRFLAQNRYVYVDFDGSRIPLFLDRKLSRREFETKIQERLFCPAFSLVPVGDVDGDDNGACSVTEKNVVRLDFSQAVTQFYVGSLFGKIDINSLPHIHPFLLPKGATVEFLVKTFRSSKYPCMQNGTVQRDLMVIHVWKNSRRVHFYKEKEELQLGGGMIVIMKKLKNPMVVGYVDSMGKMVDFPVIIERIETVTKFRHQYMILSKIYKSDEKNLVELDDHEVLSLDEGQLILIEVSGNYE